MSHPTEPAQMHYSDVSRPQSPVDQSLLDKSLTAARQMDLSQVIVPAVTIDLTNNVDEVIGSKYVQRKIPKKVRVRKEIKVRQKPKKMLPNGETDYSDVELDSDEERQKRKKKM